MTPITGAPSAVARVELGGVVRLDERVEPECLGLAHQRARRSRRRGRAGSAARRRRLPRAAVRRSSGGREEALGEQRQRGRRPRGPEVVPGSGEPLVDEHRHRPRPGALVGARDLGRPRRPQVAGRRRAALELRDRPEPGPSASTNLMAAAPAPPSGRHWRVLRHALSGKTRCRVRVRLRRVPAPDIPRHCPADGLMATPPGRRRSAASRRVAGGAGVDRARGRARGLRAGRRRGRRRRSRRRRSAARRRGGRSLVDAVERRRGARARSSRGRRRASSPGRSAGCRGPPGRARTRGPAAVDLADQVRARRRELVDPAGAVHDERAPRVELHERVGDRPGELGRVDADAPGRARPPGSSAARAR